MIWTLLLMPLLAEAQRADCSRNGYEQCVRIADPLVKEAHLIFPDNINDIDLVCRTWNRFVDCLKVYTDNCFTEQQRRQFNKAVENPIESVHQMCMQPSYQKEYLQYAPCIKSTVTEMAHCGPQYNLLVDQVSQGEIISKSTLCCSHDRFKQCVTRETRRLCDRGAPDGPASRFSSQIIDKALSFLQDQCYNYIPNSGDCNHITTDYSEPGMISTSSSEVYPWSTVQQQQQYQPEMAPKDLGASPSKTAWLPSSSLPISPEPTQTLGSRTRPASYGRSSSWQEQVNSQQNNNNNNNNNNNQPQQTVGNTVQMFPELTSPTTQNSRPDWATVSWQPSNGADKSGTTWYPAAGDQLVNEVDEPNQQGWAKPKNASSPLPPTSSVAAAIAILAFFILKL